VLNDLLATDDVPPEIWAPLHVDISARNVRARCLRGIAVECSIYAAAQRCMQVPSASRVREALSAVDELQSLRSEPIPSEEVLDAAARVITVTLTEILPPAARAALVEEVELRSRARLQDVDAGPEEGRDIDRVQAEGAPGTPRLWEDVFRDDELGSLGEWFTPDLQLRYEAIHDRVVLSQIARREAQEARARELEAERQRVAAEERARREKELAKLVVELHAWEEDAPRRRAAAIERIDEDAPRIAFYELKKEQLELGVILKAIWPRPEREEMIREREMVVRERLQADIKRQERTEMKRRDEAIDALRNRLGGGGLDGTDPAGEERQPR
jgi:hypothetical protein